MENEDKTKAEQAEQIEKAETAAKKTERSRIAALQTEFADDPEFAIKAAADGLSVDEAKAEYCNVLREKLKAKDAEHKSEIENRDSQIAPGAAAIATGDTDEGESGDFMAEARELAETKKISVTAAMKKIARTKPELHQSFLGKCRTEDKAMYAEAN